MASDEGKGSSGGSGLGFIALFFGGILFLWLASNGGSGGGLFGQASSTSLFNLGSTSISEGGSSFEYRDVETETVTPTHTPQEIESILYSAYQEVDRLKVEIAEAKLWANPSPYRDIITLSRGDVGSTDPDTEYLTLAMSQENRAPIDISAWRIESVVTNKQVSIPFGARLPKQGRINATERILLSPGESAIMLSGKSPTGGSFYENRCTGYFAENKTFYPSLSLSCPYPLDEMKRFGSIGLDDDTCYAFVQTLSSCKNADADDAPKKLSVACRTFVYSALTYQGCVDNHRTDPYFYKGPWRIYLERNDNLWRTEREILRLLDDQGRTVSVLKY